MKNLKNAIIAQLRYDPESDRYTIGRKELHCGDCFWVLIVNAQTHEPEWVDVSIESDRNGYYLIGVDGYDMDGLFAAW